VRSGRRLLAVVKQDTTPPVTCSLIGGLLQCQMNQPLPPGTTW
jgi:hypothetical protein